MCGRYTQTQELKALQSRFDFVVGEDNPPPLLQPRYNLAPGQVAPVVVREGSKVLKLMKWGLIPSWAKEASIGYKMINARAETVAQKPSFKKSLKYKRCLVVADGFYEWRKGEGGRSKIPIYLTLKQREPFAFAGLWDTWQNPDGGELESFTIITTEANAFVRPIHDRMPVILRREEEDIWLDPNLKEVDRLVSLLRPYPSEGMEGYEVSTLVNSPKHDTPECILAGGPK